MSRTWLAFPFEGDRQDDSRGELGQRLSRLEGTKRMSQSSTASIPQDLTVEELQRLVWLQAKITASIWLDENHMYESRQQAARWAFMRWLYLSRRVQS